jgi:hypothetical protein
VLVGGEGGLTKGGCGKTGPVTVVLIEEASEIRNSVWGGERWLMGAVGLGRIEEERAKK